jgi:hypothetical protein
MPFSRHFVTGETGAKSNQHSEMSEPAYSPLADRNDGEIKSMKVIRASNPSSGLNAVPETKPVNYLGYLKALFSPLTLALIGKEA